MAGNMAQNILTITAPTKDVKHFLAKFPLDNVDLTTGAWQLEREAPAAGQRRKREEELPFNLKSEKNLQYRGLPEGGSSGKPEKVGYFVLFRKPNSREFTAVPIEWWYTFKKDRRNAEATLEEAEQALRDRQKHMESMAKRDLRKTSLFAEEEVEEDPKRGKHKGLSELQFLNVKAGRKGKKSKAVDDVLGDDGDQLEMELDKLMEIDEEQAEGWDYEEDIANDDLAVNVDAEAEKEQNDNEASRLESEILKDTRAKEREGIVVDDLDDEMPDYDADPDTIEERQAEQRDKRLEQEELRQKLKATGLYDGDEESSDEEGSAEANGSPSGRKSPEGPEGPGGTPEASTIAAAGGSLASKRPLSADGEKKAKRHKSGPSPTGAQPSSSAEAAAPVAAPARVETLPEDLYLAMRRLVVQVMLQQGAMSVPQILEVLKAPDLSWASNVQRDQQLGLFVRLAAGKIKTAGHAPMQFLLLKKKSEDGKGLVLELMPGVC